MKINRDQFIEIFRYFSRNEYQVDQEMDLTGFEEINKDEIVDDDVFLNLHTGDTVRYGYETGMT